MQIERIAKKMTFLVLSVLECSAHIFLIKKSVLWMFPRNKPLLFYTHRFILHYNLDNVWSYILLARWHAIWSFIFCFKLLNVFFQSSLGDIYFLSFLLEISERFIFHLQLKFMLLLLFKFALLPLTTKSLKCIYTKRYDGWLNCFRMLLSIIIQSLTHLLPISQDCHSFWWKTNKY